MHPSPSIPDILLCLWNDSDPVENGKGFNMRILLTNDDGIYSKGIEALYLSLSEEHEVTVVAPETEQSAVGHAITFLHPLRIKPVQRNGRPFGHALDGTPADCVKIAVTELLKPAPDVVVSGINLGANVGVNVIYSGTVSAATEAAVLGIPSIAVSIDSFSTNDFSAATDVVLRVLRIMEKESLPPGVSLNINAPCLPASQVRGVRITHQGKLRCFESYDQRVDPRDHVYYWLCNTAVSLDIDPSADSSVVADGYISITPIHYNLTDYGSLEQLKRWSL